MLHSDPCQCHCHANDDTDLLSCNTRTSSFVWRPEAARLVTFEHLLWPCAGSILLDAQAGLEHVGRTDVNTQELFTYRTGPA